MPKKRLLGCSFPLVILIAILFLALLVVSFIAGPIGKSLFGDLGFPSWMQVHQPVIELPAEAIFHIAGFPVTNTLITAWISIIVLVVISFLATRRMKLIPGGLQLLFEWSLEKLLNFCNSVAGEKYGRRFFPIVATIFLYVLVNAWLSLIPGYGSIVVIEHGDIMVPLLRGANTDINVPITLALFSFVAVEFFGLRTLKIGYLKKFFKFGKIGSGFTMLFQGKVKSAFGSLFFGAIDIVVGLLELLSEFIRVVSFTFRLFGNMTAGEILLGVIAFLVPWVCSLIFYGLEAFFSFIQALIFGGLTLVFLTSAVASHEEHEAEHAH